MKLSQYLPYWGKIKKREARAFIEHFWLALVMMALGAVYSVYWSGRYLAANLVLLESRRADLMAGLYLIVTLFTFLNKRIPLLFPPAHLVYFNDFNLKKVFIKSAVRVRVFLYFLVSLFGSCLLANFKIDGTMILTVEIGRAHV